MEMILYESPVMPARPGPRYTNTGVISYYKRITVADDGTVYYAATVGTTTHIRKGTLSGTVWNTIVTFPIEVGHTNFSILALKAFSDSSLWIAGKERNSTPADTTVIYRSTDGGATFTEVYRVLENNWNTMTITRLSNGDVVTHNLYKVIKTSDNGASWEDVYDGTALGYRINGFQYDNLGRLYVLNNNDQVLAQNQFDSSWFIMYDYSLFNLISGSYISKVTDCGNLSEVCLITTDVIVGEGVTTQMRPLVIP